MFPAGAMAQAGSLSIHVLNTAEGVPVRVRLEAGQAHYHVPLLCSPFGDTTYRGS